MYSIAFPNIFSSDKTNLIMDQEATMSNLKLLLKSIRGSLIGDPYFGTKLKEVFFSANTYILKDMIIDEIYSTIRTFMPQLKLARSDIKLTQKKNAIYATINCINMID